MMHKSFEEIECSEAEEFWNWLSPMDPLGMQHDNFLYRGQWNSEWGLMPSILRQEDSNPVKRMMGNRVNSDNQVYAEMRILERFADHCNSMGLHFPDDTLQYQTKGLRIRAADEFFLSPPIWPNERHHDIMALAQHHGIPTRLLDWSKRSYVAAYFAASSALNNKHRWKDDSHIALWALDIERIALYQNVTIVNVPGSSSKNLAAQAGVFTLHNQIGERGQTFSPQPMETEFSSLPNTPLHKVTVPVSESKSIIGLCELYEVTASNLFPGYDGAATAVFDDVNCWEEI